MPVPARSWPALILAVAPAALAGEASPPLVRPAWAPLVPHHHLADLIQDGGRLLSVLRLQESPETWFYFVEKNGRLLRCAERHPAGAGRPSVSEPCEGAVTSDR